MKILKIEASKSRSVKITADTGMPIKVPLKDAFNCILEDILEYENGVFIPDVGTPDDYIYVYYWAFDRTDTSDQKEARKWMNKNIENTIILGIETIWADSNLSTWLVSYYVLNSDLNRVSKPII